MIPKRATKPTIQQTISNTKKILGRPTRALSQQTKKQQ
jgi:hypothetical protein